LRPPTENSYSTAGTVFTVVASPAKRWRAAAVLDFTMRPTAVDQPDARLTSSILAITATTNSTAIGRKIRPT
jgi:hypothetical protein